MEQKELFRAEKPAVIVSKCLMGVPCRYHGKSVVRGYKIGRKKLIEKLEKDYTIIPICPEEDGGLPTPRPPTKIVGGVWLADGEDVTAQFQKGTEIALELARVHQVKKAYLLDRSPACGKGYGMTALALEAAGVRVVKG